MADKSNDEKLKTELQLMALTCNKTKNIVDKGNLEKITRHKETLAGIIRAVDELKLQVEKVKLEEGVSIDDVQAWGQDIEKSTDEADNNVALLQHCLEEAATTAENAKLEKEEILVARKREEELKFEKKKADMKSVDKPEKSGKNSLVRLPKLVITKYDGTFEKWLSFWNTFKAEVDAQDLPAVTKFAFLQEFLQPKVREGIDGLPFSSEGYERAKNILESNYGNINEIEHAYVENIRNLPVVTGKQPAKVHQFYHTLMYNVQSLETLGKLSGCLSMVRTTLDKLPDIKPELVSGQKDWQKWNFAQLLKVLQTWREIHPKSEETRRPLGNHRHSHERSFHAQSLSPKACVYCDNQNHKSSI